MDGITILNTIVIDECARWVFPLVLAFGIFGIGAFLLMLTSSGGTDTICFGILSVLATIGLLIIVLGSQKHWRTNERNQYECIIDDSVSINEIYENYNVIEQRGKIWVLEDKIDE